MKKSILVLLIMVVCIGFAYKFSPSIPNVKADPGFDSSWDSGSSSSSDSSWSSSSGSGSSSDFKFLSFTEFKELSFFGKIIYVIEFILYVFIGIPFMLIFIYFLLRIPILLVVKFLCKKIIDKIFKTNFTPKIENLLKKYKIVSKSNNISMVQPIRITDTNIHAMLGEDFNIEEFNKNVFALYYKVCIAWSNNDSDSLKGLLSDEMYNMYRTQIQTMINKHERNVMEDINLVDCFISKIIVENDYISISTCLRMTCKDYMINDDTKKVTRGSKNTINDYTYEITFRCDRIDGKIDKCPNCGAELDEKTTTMCPHCRSVIIKPSKNYVMTQKKMVKQSIK